MRDDAQLVYQWEPLDHDRHRHAGAGSLISPTARRSAMGLVSLSQPPGSPTL
jgi:hypothetical protein